MVERIVALAHALDETIVSGTLKGGRGDDAKIGDFDPVQVRMGLKVEKEHTDNPRIALKIVLDHLREKKDYYSRLKRAGL